MCVCDVCESDVSVKDVCVCVMCVRVIYVCVGREQLVLFTPPSLLVSPAFVTETFLQSSFRL